MLTPVLRSMYVVNYITGAHAHAGTRTYQLYHAQLCVRNLLKWSTEYIYITLLIQ